VDPSCAIARNGVAFAASIHDQPFPDGKTDSTLAVYRSVDGGRTWQQSSIGIDTRSLDRAYLTVDDTKGPVRNRVYVHGYFARRTPPPAVAFYQSSDAGQTFRSVQAKEAKTFSNSWYFPANGVVSDDGTFFALVAELDNTKNNMSSGTDATTAVSSADAVLSFFLSDGEGETLELAGRITDVYYDRRVPDLSMPALAIDRSAGPFHGRIYAVWPDARYDRRTQILLSYSNDEGRTWAAPGIVSDDSATLKTNDRPNNFMPMVAVNSDGVVGISWYDRRDNPDNVGYWVRFSASLDGGETWLPSVRVSTSPHLASDDTRKNSGDTAGLAADADGVFHPVWIDNRSGIPQMWTATVKVQARPHRR